MSTTPRCPFEHIQNPDLEAEQIAETAKITVKLLDKRYPSPQQKLRGVHPKSHGCVKATFTINPDIKPELQVGLFAEPGKQFDAIIRFSNAAAVVGPDTTETKINPITRKIEDVTEHGSRGMAIKVLDVGGEVLIDDNGAHNQDFLMINQKVFAFANTEDYLRLDRILDTEGDDKAALFFVPDPSLSDEQKLRTQKSLTILGRIQSTDVGNPLGIQYFSAAPFLFGPDRVMKFSAQPCAQVPPEESPTRPRPKDYLRKALTETMSENEDLHFDFRIQVRGKDADFGKDNKLIEDASSEWGDDFASFVSVAKITIPRPQSEVDSEDNKAHCEKLAFTPWHSLVEHQPIGSINRLRKDVYAASAKHRGASMPEPDQSQEGERS
ncbi:hypothetical protein Nit79A3_2265 [Nitrosomonas sp. Is79A3]|uniref:catalase family protein n=1 Tax=Nitrosomonas sp. (strain Is79A3) TaxID=261292 RepID=UPI000215C77F